MADDLNITGLSLGPVSPLRPGQQQTGKKQGAQPAAERFAEVLRKSIQEVAELQGKADEAIRQLLSGDLDDINEVLIAVEKADIAFNTMMQIRNKIVAAYEEIMRMQL